MLFYVFFIYYFSFYFSNVFFSIIYLINLLLFLHIPNHEKIIFFFVFIIYNMERRKITIEPYTYMFFFPIFMTDD